MSRFTNDEKLAIAKRYTNETISYRKLANEAGVDHSTLRYWILLVKHHGDKAFVFPYTNYTSDFKLEVIKFVKGSNVSIREASAVFHIPDPSMVRRWLKKWDLDGEEAFTPKEKGPTSMKKTNKTPKQNENQNQNQEMTNEMLQELEDLRIEVAYLKKLRALVQEKKSLKKSRHK